METIKVIVYQDDVYEEVAKATDYTGAKLLGEDKGARDRILAADDDLWDLGRFWEEAVTAVNENLKEMLVSGRTVTTLAGRPFYEGEVEVSMAFDKALAPSVEKALRSFFIASIIGEWFKFANKGEAQGYFSVAAEFMEAAERLLYSRRKPRVPED